MLHLVSLIDDARAASPEPFTVGVGLLAQLTRKRGSSKLQLPVLNGHDLKADLAERIRQPVWIANDADCFTLSEAVDGAGAKADTVFGVIIGTGCGGGIAVRRHLLQGPNAIAGEWGHNPLPGYAPAIDGPAQPCYCGKHNCIESFISGTGFARRFRET